LFDYALVLVGACLQAISPLVWKVTAALERRIACRQAPKQKDHGQRRQIN